VRTPLVAAVAALLVLAAPAAGDVPLTQIDGPTPPAARAPLAFAIQDDPRLLDHPATLDGDLAEARALGFTHVRVTAHWDQLTRAPRSARSPGFDASDPAAYPRGPWVGLDRLVRRATAHGLQPMIDVGFFAPRWATTGGAPGDPRPRNLIDPLDFRDFAIAVARRYDGTFRPSPEAAPLPAVTIVELWNEVNLPVFWTPQRAVRPGGRIALVAPGAYRRLVALAYPALKAERPDLVVLVGDLASGPGWDPRARKAGVPALRFVRELACVDAALRPLATPECHNFRQLRGDGFAVHPYALGGSPARRPGGNRVATLTAGNLDRLTGLLGALAARGRIAPALQAVYVTEFGYLTRVTEPGTRPLRNPFPTVSPQHQAAWELLAHQLAWAQPQVRMFAHFLVRDTLCAPGVGPECVDWSSGYRYAHGTAKPLLDSLRAGLLVEDNPDGTRTVWARMGTESARGAAVLQYETRDAVWRSIGPDDVRSYRGAGADGIVELTVRPLDAIDFRLFAAG
jgi:hypothetical protein